VSLSAEAIFPVDNKPPNRQSEEKKVAHSDKTGASRSGVVRRRIFARAWLFLLLPTLLVLSPGALRPLSGQAWAAAAEAPGKGKQLLNELVRRANQEGELVATLPAAWSKSLIQPLSDAFKKRFGLNIKLSLVSVESSMHFPVAIAETQAGAPATYGVVQGDDAEIIQLVGAGATQKVENWEVLLAEINPLVRSGKVRPDQISRGPFKDHSFMYAGHVKQIVYNTRLISERDLPRTHRDLAGPKYKGKFTQPPWTSHWEIAPVAFEKFDRNEWLDIVRQAGKNSGAVLSESAGVQRVVLGEFAFALSQDRHLRRILAKDPNAPIAYRFFDDYNLLNGFSHSVRAKARHPAAAVLFALWMTTPEAQAIWQPSDLQAVPYGESQLDQDFRQSIKNSKARAIGFLDNDKTVELLNWYRTEEGRKYLDALARAIRGE
jgi:ABC-type Fe3+ transport system substrate-binding protein